MGSDIQEWVTVLVEDFQMNRNAVAMSVCATTISNCGEAGSAAQSVARQYRIQNEGGRVVLNVVIVE